MTIHCTSTDIQTIHQALGYYRQLPTAINKHIALLSSDEQTFKESTPIYQNALRHSNFDYEFTYTQDASQRTRRNRQRNIIWFNPPFSKSVNTNIDTLKIRNTLKISYSCMNNVKSIITKHNAHIIRNSQPQNTETDNCNCMRQQKRLPTTKTMYDQQSHSHIEQHERH